MTHLTLKGDLVAGRVLAARCAHAIPPQINLIRASDRVYAPVGSANSCGVKGAIIRVTSQVAAR
jgi:hypothetical protein